MQNAVNLLSMPINLKYQFYIKVSIAISSSILLEITVTVLLWRHSYNQFNLILPNSLHDFIAFNFTKIIRELYAFVVDKFTETFFFHTATAKRVIKI